MVSNYTPPTVTSREGQGPLHWGCLVLMVVVYWTTVDGCVSLIRPCAHTEVSRG